MSAVVTNKRDDKENTVSKNSDSNDKPTIDFLNGIRCLCCLWIIFMHTYAFSSVFPYDSPPLKYIREFPILGFFALSTLAVDAFWILSGFLCEYQLHYYVDKNKPFWPLWFMINRLFRLYPLYLLNLLLGWLSPMVQCNDINQLLKSISFIEIFFLSKMDDENGKNCSGAGWTVNVDVHGYILIIVLAMLFKNVSISYKKLLMWLFFIISVIIAIDVAYKHDISWPVCLFGLNGQDPALMEKYFEKNPEQKDQFPDGLKLYTEHFDPDHEFDIYSTECVEYRRRTNTWMHQLYFTSITKHGAAMFLGAILAMNIITHHKNKNNIPILSNIIKLIVGCFGFYISMNLRMDINYRPPVWTVIYDKLLVVAIFFSLDAMFSIYQNKDNIVSYMISVTLSNKIWKFLSKFTYGIYLFHVIPVLIIVVQTFPTDLKNGGVGIDYGFLYIFKIATMAFFIAFIASVICYYLLEYPTTWFRYKYIRPRYIKEIKKDKTQ